MTRQQAGVQERDCPVCGKRFLPYRTFQRACSRTCRDKLETTNDAPHAKVREFECRLCGTTFSKLSTSGHNYFCDSCLPLAAEARAERKNANRRVDANPQAKSKNFANNLRQNYGMTVEQHAAMVKAHGNRCAICGEPPKPDGVRAASRLHVDHDHTTGQLRGLLCNHCNRGIGAFRDRPDLMELAISYLRTYEP